MRWPGKYRMSHGQTNESRSVGAPAVFSVLDGGPGGRREGLRNGCCALGRHHPSLLPFRPRDIPPASRAVANPSAESIHRADHKEAMNAPPNNRHTTVRAATARRRKRPKPFIGQSRTFSARMRSISCGVPWGFGSVAKRRSHDPCPNYVPSIPAKIVAASAY